MGYRHVCIINVNRYDSYYPFVEMHTKLVATMVVNKNHDVSPYSLVGMVVAAEVLPMWGKPRVLVGVSAPMCAATLMGVAASRSTTAAVGCRVAIAC